MTRFNRIKKLLFYFFTLFCFFSVAIFADDAEMLENRMTEIDNTTSSSFDNADEIIHLNSLTPNSEVISSGELSDTIEYVLYNDGTMIVSGTGTLEDSIYSKIGDAVSNIKKIEILDGITAIGDNVRFPCISLIIPDSVTSIGKNPLSYQVESLTIPISASIKYTSTPYPSNCLTSVHFTKGTGIGVDYTDKTCINTPWYVSGDTITSITFDDGITKIGDYALKGQKKITSLMIPKTVESIGSSTFYGCNNLSSIVVETGNQKYSSYDCNVIVDVLTNKLLLGCNNSSIPNSVITIGANAFRNSNKMNSLCVPDSVTCIEDNAFYGCTNISFLEIPISTSIGSDAFYNVNNIKNLKLTKGNGVGVNYDDTSCKKTPWYLSKDSMELVMLENGITRIGDFTLAYQKNITSIDIPDSVQYIGARAFINCGLHSFSFPDSITTVEDAVLAGNPLTSIDIPNKVTSIGYCAFSGCHKLTEIIIPNSVKTIDVAAFQFCTDLCEITIPNSVTSIGTHAFDGCEKLTSLFIPKSVQSIGENICKECKSLYHIEVDINNKKYNSIDQCNAIIDTAAHTLIQGCSSTVIPNTVKKIDNFAFCGIEGLTDIAIPSSVTSIGEGAFCDCSLTKINIPDSVKSIGTGAFLENDVATYLSIPISTSIGNSAFSGVDNLTTIRITKGTGVGINYTSSSFKNTPWYVSKNKLESLILDDGIITIGNYTFSTLTLSSIVIPETVFDIKQYAFNSCNNMNVYLPSTVNNIESKSFSNVKSIFTNAKEGLHPSGWENMWTTNLNIVQWSASYDEFCNVAFGKYTINFMPNTGIGSTMNSLMNLECGKEYVLSKNTYEKDYYYFDHWNTNADGTGISFNDEAKIKNLSVTLKNEIILYAIWKPVEYSITYHLDSNVINTNPSIYNVESNILLNSPIRINCNFVGWYLTDDFQGDTIESTVDLHGNLDLYPKWSWKYNTSNPSSNVAPGEVEKGTLITLTCEDSQASIYYTLDESDPTKDSNKYINQIVINDDVIVKAIAINPDKNDSEVITFEYTIKAEDNGDIIADDEDDYIPNGLWTNNLDDFDYDPSIKKYTYDETNLRVYDNKTLLTLNKDYSLSYKNNTKAGTATLTVTGKGNYAGTLVKEFTINPISLTSSNTEITLNKDLFKTNNKAQKPTVSSVIYKDADGKEYKLKNNTDYTVSYSNASSKDADTYQVIIKGKGNYSTSDDLIKEYTITEKTLVSSLSISGIKNTAYTGEEITFDITIKNGKTVLSNDEIASNFEIEYGNNTSVGTATVTITAKDNTDYEGSVTKTFKITGTNISKVTYSKLPQSSYQYDGQAKVPTQTLSYKKSKTETIELEKDTHYTVEYQNNTLPGTATIIYTGNPANGYEGTKKVTFKITGTALSKAKFELNSTTLKTIPNQIYTGEEIEIEGISLYYQSDSKDPSTRVDLTKDSDYTVSYSKNINVGTATITFTGINGYTGTVKKTFKITTLPLTDSDISISNIDSQTYLKGGVKPDVTVKHKGESLVLNKDYTVSYKNNTAVNDNTNPKKQTTVTIKGKGNYSGTITKNFTITPKNINEVSITVPDKVYSNKANIYKSTPTLTDSDGKKLAAGTDYDKNISYRYRFDTYVTDTSVKPNKSIIRLAGDIVNPKDIIPVNTVIQVQINTLPNKNYTGSITSSFRIIASDISKASITIPAQYYKGKSIELSKSDLTVKLGKEILSLNDYEIVSYDNNTNKGSASLTIKGKGNYGGTKTIKFSIQSRTLGHTIIFNSNGGTGTMKDQIITKNTAITANSFKKAGYTFKGWSTTQNGSVEYSNKQSFTYNPLTAGLSTTLYAVWE